MESRYRLPLASLVVLALVVAAHSGPARGITLHLDFEDGTLPSAHGWLPIGSPSCSFVTDVTNKGLSTVLQLSGHSHFGWLFDLEAAGVDPHEDWVFSVDLRATSEDVGMYVDGEPFHQNYPGVPLRDWQWHELRLESRYGVTETRAILDGVVVLSWRPNGDPTTYSWGHQQPRHYLHPSDYQVGWYFGNTGWSSTFYADNIHFENVAAAEVIPEPAALLFLTCGLSVGAFRRRTLRVPR